ncbi:E6 protein [Omikronpapillomavirus 1]|uniref:Protein E6 n=1 Tax=Phocoena spinipinnis papillomavirus (isolate Burmeister's porpoise/Peru/PsPV1) TaxID=654916 RepID=Q8UZ19_PSPVP|nr:E6 protein [Omikronpapillomavirus 1]CAC80269.1 E6 protein [Omikronpapillomavirus 1]
MAEESPCTIKSLCLAFGLRFDELLISCVFCRTNLRTFEVWSFMTRNLKVLWRKGFPFACCPKCLEVQALVAWLRHFERSGNAKAVEEDTGESLGDLPMRCVGCFKPMSASEKQFQIEDKRPFTKVSGYWRGFCLNCLTTPPPLTRYFISVTNTGRTPLISWGFDPPPRQLSESGSSASSWTITTTTTGSSSNADEHPLSDAESDGETEALI